MKKKLLIISGMTGLGKTNTTYQLARKLNLNQVIIGDSVQIYKNWPIASNFPPKEYQTNLKYHLLGSEDANLNRLDTVDFKNKVLNTIADIKDDIMIIEGGSCFYLDYLLNSKPEEFTREQIQQSFEMVKSFKADFTLKEKFQEMFPNIQIPENDTYRLEKAFRYALLTNGKRYINDNFQKEGQCLKDLYDVRGVFIYSNTFAAQQFIDKRCDQMLQSGFLQECLDYLDTAKQFNVLPLGYKEAFKFFQDLHEELNSFNYYTRQQQVKQQQSLLRKFVEDYQTKTRKYSSYQRKYFRQKIKDFIWIEGSNGIKINDIVNIVNLPREQYEKQVLSRENQSSIQLRENEKINKSLKSQPLTNSLDTVYQQVIEEVIPRIKVIDELKLKQASIV